MYENYGTRARAQNERTPGRDEVKNSAGGYVHKASDWDRLDRFLILGTQGGTFYVGERKLTNDNIDNIIGLIQTDGLRVVNRVVEISKSGRAHKNDPALFVLAAAMKLGDEQTRKLAGGVMPEVARTGTMLFKMAEYVQAFGGWGRNTKRAFQRWYTDKAPDRLAYQLLKYRQRDGWSHRDILRLAHPVTTDESKCAMFKVTTDPQTMWPTQSEGKLPRLYTGYLMASAEEAKPDPSIIRDYGLSWEMLPTEWLKDDAVNKQLLKSMPLMATIRQLGKMTANGTLKPLSPELKLVEDRLTDDETIAKSRIHPMHYLLALKTYEAGGGYRSKLTWSPDGRIVAALNKGFYKAFANVETTGKSFLLGVDVSGSMTHQIGDTGLSCYEGAAAMAMVIARSEPNHFIHGFSGNFIPLGIGPNDTLPQAFRKMSGLPFNSTDCAVPMLYATKNKLHVDTFVVITDSETWSGAVKPVDALNEYRRKLNPAAKMVVVAMVANHFTVADPNDAGMLDVVGFDANVPQIVSQF